MSQRLLQFGYYIVEPAVKPNWITLPCSRILSISKCISAHHPDLDEFFWVGSEKKVKLYQEKFRLSHDELHRMKEHVSELVDSKRLGVDGIFSSLDDAMEILEKYLYTDKKLRVIGVSIEEENVSTLREEMGDIFETLELIEPIGECLGYEILGWDIVGFHSYLCN